MRKSEQIKKRINKEKWHIPEHLYPHLKEILYNMSIPVDYFLDEKTYFYTEDIYNNNDIRNKVEPFSHYDDKKQPSKDFEKAIDFISKKLCNGFNIEQGRFFNVVEITKYAQYFMYKWVPFDKASDKPCKVVFKRGRKLWLLGGKVVKKEIVYNDWCQSTIQTAQYIFIKAFVWTIIYEYITWVNLDTKNNYTAKSFFEYIKARCHLLATGNNDVKVKGIGPRPYFVNQNGENVYVRKIKKDFYYSTSPKILITENGINLTLLCLFYIGFGLFLFNILGIENDNSIGGMITMFYYGFPIAILITIFGPSKQ